MVGRLKLEPVSDARLDFAEREATLARRAQEGGDDLVELKLCVGRRFPRLRGERAHVDAAAFAKFQPAEAR